MFCGVAERLTLVKKMHSRVGQGLSAGFSEFNKVCAIAVAGWTCSRPLGSV